MSAADSPAPVPLLERRFVRIAEGLVHVRSLAGSGMPLMMVHASPASGRGLVPLMTALKEHGIAAELIAPDTLGNGDSAPPAPETPDIAYYADSLRRLLDVMKIERIDLYGAHTGARTACEFAILFPERVNRLVLDGITEYPPELKRDILAQYAPAVAPAADGSHMIWAFNFVRDQAFHFPYFRRDPAHRQSRPMPTPEYLHAHVVDVLKGLETYHKAYNAAFRYAVSERLPLVSEPTLVLQADIEPAALQNAAGPIAKLIPGATRVVTSGGIPGKAHAISAFLRT
jgi:pimeloyl-ACP methyl ester carboxylesterase